MYKSLCLLSYPLRSRDLDRIELLSKLKCPAVESLILFMEHKQPGPPTVVYLVGLVEILYSFNQNQIFTFLIIRIHWNKKLQVIHYIGHLFSVGFVYVRAQEYDWGVIKKGWYLKFYFRRYSVIFNNTWTKSSTLIHLILVTIFQTSRTSRLAAENS